MVVNVADGVNSAGARTRVNTFLVHAGLVKSTITAQKTFRVAAVPWVPSKARQTSTSSSVALGITFGIRATWVLVAWVHGVFRG